MHASAISLLTPSLPERAHLLGELAFCVERQDRGPREWLIAVDHDRQGPAAVRNRLADESEGEWLAFVDDDDLIDPWHLATLLDASEGADVIHSDWRTLGRDGFGPDPCEDYSQLTGRNWIPVTALVRRSVFERVGGFPDERDEDHGLWRRVLAAGGTFRRVPVTTWTYRFLGGNRSMEGTGG